MNMKTWIIILGAAAVFLTCVIIWGSLKWLKVVERKVSIEGLPDFLNGFRILHISDLHGDNRDRMNLDIWKTVEKLEFDMAVITGDVIVTGFEEILPHVDGLKRLTERVPVYFVEGNHDRRYYARLVELFASIGITALSNESVLHHVAYGSFELIGVRDLNSMQGLSYDGILPLLESRRTDFTLVLTHEPKLYDEMAHTGAELVLAGHTHGGQVRLPFLPTLYAPRQGIFPKYGDGLYGGGSSYLYISRGIGTTVFPIRFWNRPEIAILELR